MRGDQRLGWCAFEDGTGKSCRRERVPYSLYCAEHRPVGHDGSGALSGSVPINPAVIYVRFAEDGSSHIRKWDLKPFDGATAFMAAVGELPPDTDVELPAETAADLSAALTKIAREVEVVSGVIRLERDLSGTGRLKVSTAIHRIRELVALAQAEAGGE